MNPKISIITPSFNQGEFIEETILSVLEQDYPNLEFIIIDGGSTDNTLDVIEKYKSKIDHFVSEHDKGQSEAINKGLKKCNGEIITWICSDDLLLPGALRNAAQIFYDNPDAGMIHGKSILFGKGKKDDIRGAQPKDLELRYFAVIPFPQPSSFFRKEITDKCGMLDDSLHFAMDYDLLIRVAGNYEIICCDHIFSKYRLHDESKTVKNLNSFAREWARVFSRFLRSVSNGQKWIAQIETLGIYHHESEMFTLQKRFTEKELETIVLYFLHNQMICAYETLDTRMAAKIVKLIEKIDPHFSSESGARKIGMRSRFIPAFLLEKLRILSR
ncbi:MAG: glycosyltransferase [Bacteroidetes bacterium]|nr:MAG: glycosyltransferase [Bacteroidota bacterium]REJ99704.1 MAG: glycosyltransferase [Bacteroidota bacterium]REK47703.1 MAG: glycosyltransferase [Bacteroidota bacterium]